MEKQYYCYWCKIHFCEKCGSFDENKIGLEKYPHYHNLIYIDVKSNNGMNNIDVIKLGENKIFSSIEEKEDLSNNHQSICNSCGKSIENIRYICLNCKPGEPILNGYYDICNTCIHEILYNPNTKKTTIIKKVEKEGHDLISHIYLVLYYSTGYYSY
jgi:hypothetical protein